MKRTAAICVALAFSLVSSADADYGVTDHGAWPKSWPAEDRVAHLEDQLTTLQKEIPAFEGELRVQAPAPLDGPVPDLLRTAQVGDCVLLQRSSSMTQMASTR
jgi:hypothetical protein